MDTNELQTLVAAVKALMGTADRMDVQVTDPRIAPMMGTLHKAKARIHLSTAEGIIVTVRGNDIGFARIGRGNAPAAPQVAAPVPAPTPAPAPAVKPVAAPAPVNPAPAPVVVEVDPVASKPKTSAKNRRAQHSYRPPKMLKDVIDILTDDASHVVWFAGPTGCGKTVAAHYIAQALGMQLFQINCHRNMGPEALVGERTIAIDEVSKQNFVQYQEGTVVKAMQCGLDADGNEVGAPGLLFIDEAGAIPTEVGIMLNRLLESDDPRRTITLEHDGGRVIRSHSRFRIILSANTVGRGANSMVDAMYTAQTDALDISILNRIAAVFRFGYDRDVERGILMEKIGDDKAVRQLIKFRDQIRGYVKAGRLSTPFSTRHIVKIADLYRIFKNAPKAIYLAVMEQLLPQEQVIFNEAIVAEYGVDIVKEHSQDGIDYM